MAKQRSAAKKRKIVAFKRPAPRAAKPALPVAKPAPPVIYRRVKDPLIEPPSMLETLRLRVKENAVFEQQNAIFEQQTATPVPEPVPQVGKRLTIDPPPTIETPTLPPVMMNGTVFRDTVYYKQFRSAVEQLIAIQVFVLSVVVGYMILKGIRKLTHHETTRERSQRLRKRRRQRLAAIETTFHLLCLLPFRIIWLAIRMTTKLLVFIFVFIHFGILLVGYCTAIAIRFARRFLRHCWRIVVPPGECARCRIRTFALLYCVSMAITRLAAYAHALAPLGLSLTSSPGPLPAWIVAIRQIRTYQDFCVMFLVSVLLHTLVRQRLQRLHNCYWRGVQRGRRTAREERTGRAVQSILTLREDIVNSPRAEVRLDETMWLSLFTDALTTWKCLNCADCSCRFRCSSCCQCLQCSSCSGDCAWRHHTAALQHLLHKS